MHALALAVALPFLQAWGDPGLIARDDDWSGVPGVVGHRGDGLTAEAGTDPRAVPADGSGTPVDVNANERDPRSVGLPAGVTEFELADPVVALQGSASAAAPHLVLSLDTRGRSGVTVRYRLRDVDASSNADAVQAVALQYRVGASGDFAPVPGGFVADATTGPGEATLVTPVSAALPPAADGRPLVQLRILTTNAVGQDEWVGVDDIEVEASGEACPGPGPEEPPSEEPPSHGPPSEDPRSHRPSSRPAAPLWLTRLALTPPSFSPASSGPAVRRSGRAGTSLTFRLSRAATVRFRVLRPIVAHVPLPRPLARADAGHGDRRLGRSAARPHGRFAGRELGRFSVRGSRGHNRLRFSGRLRGRPLAPGRYRLVARAVDRIARTSAAATAAFRIRATAATRRTPSPGLHAAARRPAVRLPETGAPPPGDRRAASRTGGTLAPCGVPWARLRYSPSWRS